jgi:hypothetical protein
MTHISRKRAAPNDDLCLDNPSDTESILVPTSRDIISFSASSASASAHNQPKLPSATTQTLAPLVTMVVQNAQSSLTTFKSWKIAHVFLVDAFLKQTQSELPRWLWKYEYPADIDQYEKNLSKQFSSY